MAIRCFSHHRPHLPAQALVISIAFAFWFNIYIHICATHLSIIVKYLSYVAFCACLTTSLLSFLSHLNTRVLLNYPLRIGNIAFFIWPIPFRPHLLPWIAVRRYYYMKRRRLPSKTILVSFPSAVPTTSTLCHRFRPALPLYYCSSSYRSIENIFQPHTFFISFGRATNS